MMFNYQAPNPYPEEPEEQDFLGNIKALVYDFLFSPLVSPSSLIGRMILSVQTRAVPIISIKKIQHLSQTYQLLIENGTVKTHDGAVLETIQFTHKGKQSFRHIIKFIGDDQLQDWLTHFAMDAQSLNATVIGFNYRGVGNSSSYPEVYRDLLTDGMAQVQRLLDKGIPSTHILLDGHALGGSVATMVAQHFHDKGQPMYLWNDRSFSDLHQTAVNIRTPLSYSSAENTPPANRDWCVDVASAYKTISPEYKGYLFISKKAACGHGDGVIPHANSLHKAVKSMEKEQGYRTGHKVTTLGPGGHNFFRTALYSKNEPGRNGQEIYKFFVESHLKPDVVMQPDKADCISIQPKRLSTTY